MPKIYHEVIDYTGGPGEHVHRIFESKEDAMLWISERPAKNHKFYSYLHRIWHGNHFNYEANKGRLRIMSRDEGNMWIERMPPKQDELELCGPTPAKMAHDAATRFAENAAAELKKAKADAETHGDKRPKINRHKLALDVQDAGNLRAIARSFVEVCDDATRELGVMTSVWRDPAVILFAAKIAQLTGCDDGGFLHYSKAYEACKAQQKEAVWR